MMTLMMLPAAHAGSPPSSPMCLADVCIDEPPPRTLSKLASVAGLQMTIEVSVCGGRVQSVVARHSYMFVLSRQVSIFSYCVAAAQSSERTLSCHPDISPETVVSEDLRSIDSGLRALGWVPDSPIPKLLPNTSNIGLIGYSLSLDSRTLTRMVTADFGATEGYPMLASLTLSQESSTSCAGTAATGAEIQGL
jgi:hypothetical protein